MTDYGNFGTEYEVKCSETWAWYEGFVTDYNESSETLRVRYAGDWKQPEEMAIGLVRAKYDDSLSLNWRPALHEEVECKARAEENEPYGWWTCKISGMALPTDDDEEQFMVSFIGWGDEHNETLGASFIRRKSTAPALSARNMMKKRYAVPPQVEEWVAEQCAKGTILGKLMPHKNIASQIVHIYYSTHTQYLVLVGQRRVLEAMEKIIHCFFEKQKILLGMERKALEMEQDAENKRALELKAEKRTFNVHPLLAGYLRGRQNANLIAVRRQQHVLRVDPMATSCYVAATDAATLEWAIDRLHIVARRVLLPQEEMGQIIGTKGQQITDIKQRANVIKVISWKKWKDEFKTLQHIQRQRHRNGYDGESEREPAHFQDDEASMFGAADTVDLSTGFVSERETSRDPLSPDGNVVTDSVVIIGRKSRVDLCIFMIRMALDSFRAISRARKSAWRLREEINRLKGNQPGSPRRGGGQRRGPLRGQRGSGRRGARSARGGARAPVDRRSDRRERGRGDRSDRDRNRGDRRDDRRDDRGDRGDRSERRRSGYNERGDRGRGRRDRDRGRGRQRNYSGDRERGDDQKDTSPPIDSGDRESGPTPQGPQYRKKQAVEDVPDGNGNDDAAATTTNDAASRPPPPGDIEIDGQRITDQHPRTTRKRKRKRTRKREGAPREDGAAANEQ